MLAALRVYLLTGPNCLNSVHLSSEAIVNWSYWGVKFWCCLLLSDNVKKKKKTEEGVGYNTQGNCQMSMPVAINWLKGNL